MLITFTSRSSMGRLNSFKYRRKELAESDFTFRSSPTPYNASLCTNPTPPSLDMGGDFGSSAVKIFELKMDSFVVEITPPFIFTSYVPVL